LATGDKGGRVVLFERNEGVSISSSFVGRRAFLSSIWPLEPHRH
jgi:hypothetical protein